MNFLPGLGLLAAKTATSYWLPIARAPAQLTCLYFIYKIFYKFFLSLFELFMIPHYSLNIFPDILAIRTDIGYRNNIMYGMATVRVLQGE